MSGLSLQTSGSVSSRFVSQNELDKVKETKDQEWKAAYARLGQEPPPRPQEEEYDPRSLFEKLQQKKDIKREEWDEKMKMSNQFRGLDSEEINFLSDEKSKSEREAKSRREEEDAILNQFRSAQRRSPSPPPSLLAPYLSTSSASTSTSSLVKPGPKPKPKKSVLPPGVKVKKASTNPSPSIKPSSSSSSAVSSTKEDSRPSTVKNSPQSAPPPIAAIASTSSESGQAKKRGLVGLLGPISDSDSDSEDDDAAGPEKKLKLDS